MNRLPVTFASVPAPLLPPTPRDASDVLSRGGTCWPTLRCRSAIPQRSTEPSPNAPRIADRHPLHTGAPACHWGRAGRRYYTIRGLSIVAESRGGGRSLRNISVAGAGADEKSPIARAFSGAPIRDIAGVFAIGAYSCHDARLPCPARGARARREQHPTAPLRR